MVKKKEYMLVVDTREQKPLWKRGVKVHKLNAGDYSIEGYEDKIAIERKSLSDAYSTALSGHQRFKKELERAKDLDYFAIVIEGNFKQFIHKGFKGASFTRVSGFQICKIYFSWSIKHNIPIFFCDDRNHSKIAIKYLLEAYLNAHNFP